ncbi:MAG: RNA polymerase sigma-70 factor [Phocaeicola sp.]|nr:RNA polymerase sigma-70 factor [Phocaeicola sp.]
MTWYSRATHFAYDYVLSASDAENIVQDVFLHLYERRELLETYTNLTAYLFTSIKNKCLDHLRKKVAEQEAINELQSELGMTLQLKYDSLEILNTSFPDENDIKALLDKSLQKLPERCRTIFIMSKLEGKKQKQIAEELHLSLHTIESQMGIAYKKLREELKDCLPLLCFLFALS